MVPSWAGPGRGRWRRQIYPVEELPADLKYWGIEPKNDTSTAVFILIIMPFFRDIAPWTGPFPSPFMHGRNAEVTVPCRCMAKSFMSQNADEGNR
jgi:hypothetical protein